MFKRKREYRSADEGIADAWFKAVGCGAIIVLLTIIGAAWVIWQTLGALGSI